MERVKGIWLDFGFCLLLLAYKIMEGAMYCRYFSVAIASVIVVEFCEIELCLLGAVRLD